MSDFTDQLKQSIKNFGHYSAMAENPAGYTSEGWKLQDNGEFKNQPTQGTEQLRTINGITGIIGLTGYGGGAALSATPVITPQLTVGQLPAIQTAIGNAAGSMAAGMTADQLSKATTGKTIGGHFRSALASTGTAGRMYADVIPEAAWDFANPFYLVNSNKIGESLGKGINYAHDYFRDLLWLKRNQPHYWKQYVKDPSFARRFFRDYSEIEKQDLGNPTLDQIKEITPYLEQLSREFQFKPKIELKRWSNPQEELEYLREGLMAGKEAAQRYNTNLEFLKQRNPVLYNIAKESPQYLDQIVSDFKSGKISNLEQYVKDLIIQANTLMRAMYLDRSMGEKAIKKAFLTIGGHAAVNKYSLDMGNTAVVNDGIFGGKYGNNAMQYTPRNLTLEGPVETWWSQRFPKFKDNSITYTTKGMHSSLIEENGFLPLIRSSNQIWGIRQYIDKHNVPSSYGSKKAHVVFFSPNKGASIADWFTADRNWRERESLGYKKGGKLDVIESFKRNRK